MARAKFVKKAVKPNPVVTAEDIKRAKDGEEGAASYWWWKFRFGGKHYSKTRPRPSQLTGSEFLSEVYSIQEEIQDASPETVEELRDLVDEWAERIEEIGSECEEKVYNMPDSLQDSETGELLRERAEAMQCWAEEIRSVDLDEDRDDEDRFVDDKMLEISEADPGV